MVRTRHCCWGECKTDSRCPEKWPESLKELEKSGQKVFIPFPKPAKDFAKCKRWLVTTLVPEAFFYFSLANFATGTASFIFFVGTKR